MILVVGGAGYIGSHIVKQLVKNGQHVVVYDNLSTGHREFVKGNVPFILGDLSNQEQLRLLFSNYPIQAVMHFAANAYVGESVTNPQKYYLNNVSNTLNLLEVMREFNVETFVFSSTCATYGVPMQIPIKEDHPQLPINPYGRSKWMVEQILEDYSNAYGLKYAALRYFNAAGADQECEIGEWHDPETHLIPLILDAALGKRNYIQIFGTDYNTEDGTCVRDYIHVEDLATAHILALHYLKEQQQSNVFNLGNGKGYSVREIIRAVEKVTGKGVPTVETTRREGDPAILVGSAEKANAVLQWETKYKSIESIIETAWKWHVKLWGNGD
ncbi:MAG TPA: UDP-glucose 4-epimerase GalE [Bacillus bacterium]|nr:UDP-glucose 4-epimerase GalE [Bacillus sp. (in: firmicutes)]